MNNAYQGGGKRLDVTGERYGRLTALEFVRIDRIITTGKPYRKSVWRFRCDCGNVVERQLGNVRRGETASCGCLKTDSMSAKWDASRKPFGESSFNGLFVHYQAGAQDRGFSWELSRDDFRALTEQPCQYCGLPPSQSYRTNSASNGDYTYSGVDRVDTAQGYVLGNVVPCCMACNFAKGKKSVDEFLSWVERVYRHQHPEVDYRGK